MTKRELELENARLRLEVRHLKRLAEPAQRLVNALAELLELDGFPLRERE